MRTPHRLLLIVSAAALVATACGDDDENDDAATEGATTEETTAAAAGDGEPDDLTVMMPVQIGMSFIADMVAVSCGFYEDEGLDVEVTFAQGGPQALQQLVGGNVDIIRNNPVEMIQAVVNEDAPLISIGMVNQHTNFTLTSAQEDSYALEDLAGLRVGVPSLGGNAEQSLGIALRGVGVDPTTIQLQAVGGDASGFAALEEGLVDALFVSRSTVAQYRAAGADPYTDELSDVNPLLGTNLVTQTDYLEENRDVVLRYVRALHAAKVALIDEEQRRELIPCVADGGWDLPQLQDAEAAHGIIGSTASTWLEEGEENLLRNVPELWERGMADLVEQGLVPEDTEPTDFYTNDVLDEAIG